MDRPEYHHPPGLGNVTWNAGSSLGIDTSNAGGPTTLTITLPSGFGVSKLGANARRPGQLQQRAGERPRRLAGLRGR